MGKNIWRHRAIAGLLLLVAGLGCNPLTVPFFMLFGVDDKREPEFKIASPDHEVKVLILAYTAPDLQSDQVGIDRQLGLKFARQLQDRCAYNKEKVKIVPIHKVEKFKSDHPGWKSMSDLDIGKYFDADYVISLDIVRLGLYEPGSSRTLFKGTCKIDLAVTDLSKPLDGPVFKKSFSSEYPKTRGPLSVADDNNTDKFRDKFINRIAGDLCWNFTAHVFAEECQCD